LIAESTTLEFSKIYEIIFVFPAMRFARYSHTGTI